MIRIVFFLLLFLFTSFPAYSWEPVSRRGTDCTIGESRQPLCGRRCSFTNSNYSTCSAYPSSMVEAWVADRTGSAYAYTVRTTRDANSQSVLIIHQAYRKLLEEYDSSSVDSLPDSGDFSPVYNAPRTDESCSSSIDGAGIFAVSSGSTSFNSDGCTYTADSSVTCWDSDNSPTGSYCMSDWSAVSSGEVVVPPSGDGGASSDVSSDFDSSRPPYMTPVSSCANLDSCLVVDGQSYSIDQDAISSGSISVVGGQHTPSNPFDPGPDGGSAPTYGDGSTTGGGSTGGGSTGGGSTGGGESTGDSGGFGEDAWGDFLGDGWGDGMGGEGAGGAGGNEPGVPVESVDIQEAAVDWSSGLSTSGTCPAPQEVDVLGQSLSFSYEPFCDLASYIRALILAAAYISAAFLVFRGLT